MKVNTDILIILCKLIINLATFMFSLCIFIIDIALSVKITIVFQKFGVGACALGVLRIMFNWYVFCLSENMKITDINLYNHQRRCFIV